MPQSDEPYPYEQSVGDDLPTEPMEKSAEDPRQPGDDSDCYVEHEHPFERKVLGMEPWVFWVGITWLAGLAISSYTLMFLVPAASVAVEEEETRYTFAEVAREVSQAKQEARLDAEARLNAQLERLLNDYNDNRHLLRELRDSLQSVQEALQGVERETALNRAGVLENYMELHGQQERQWLQGRLVDVTKDLARYVPTVLPEGVSGQRETFVCPHCERGHVVEREASAPLDGGQ